jgi:hypothetical protein
MNHATSCPGTKLHTNCTMPKTIDRTQKSPTQTHLTLHIHLLKTTTPTESIHAASVRSAPLPTSLCISPLEDDFPHKTHKTCTNTKKPHQPKATCLNPQNKTFTVVAQTQKNLCTQKKSYPSNDERKASIRRKAASKLIKEGFLTLHIFFFTGRICAWYGETESRQ